MRWTRLAITVMIAACAKGEKDQNSQSAANTPAPDTAMRTEATPVDTSHAVSARSGEAKESGASVAGKIKAEADTTARNQVATTAAGNSGGVTGAEAMTGVRTTPPSRPLSVDQVKRLQAALNKVGCHVGTPDGVEGPGTQRAINCGLKKYNLASDDLNGLYRKLGLDF